MNVMYLWLIGGLWGGCGLAAFATYLYRRRRQTIQWFELSVFLIASSLLGAVALFAVLTEKQDDI